MRKAFLVFALSAISSLARAQGVPIQDLPLATTPLSSSDLFAVTQGNVFHKLPGTSLGLAAGLGTMSTQNANAVVVTGGVISGVAITGGTISGVAITGNITGHASLDLAAANNLSDLTDGAMARTHLGLGTIATQNANAVAITGGTINAASQVNVGVANPNSSWVPSFWLNTTQASILNVVSPTGLYGILGATRGSDNAGNVDSIAIGGYAENNNTSAVAPVGTWGGYFDVAVATGVNVGTIGIEIDVGNQNAIANIDPYNFHPTKLTANLWLACGGAGFGGTGGTLPCSTAIGILTNTKTFTKGIDFASDALVTTNGSGGNGIAIEMADRQTVKWVTSTSSTAAELWGAASGGLMLQCNTQTQPPSQNTSLFLCANLSGTNGEINFLNNEEYPGHAGGFEFRQKTGTNTSDQIFVVSESGIHVLGFAVGSLPVAPGAGTIAYVTDQMSACPALGGTFTGGGAVNCMAFYNGSAWIYP